MRQGEALIVAAGEAAIIGVGDQSHLRELGRDHRRTAVGGHVVDDDDLRSQETGIRSQSRRRLSLTPDA